MQITLMVLGGVFAALTMSACESTPKWVKTGTYTGKDSKAFYGIGEVMGIRNEPLAWDAAENRARAQMVKVLSTYTAYLMKIYAQRPRRPEISKDGRGATHRGSDENVCCGHPERSSACRPL